MNPWLRRLGQRRIWKRLLVERGSEPLHLNLASVPVAAFGSVQTKIDFDIIIRQYHAFALLNAARKLRAVDIRRATVVEFGVAAGAGLMNICDIAARVSEELDVAFDVAGFDTGSGMPAPRDYRDHPEHYSEGDFPMDVAALRARLPSNAQLIVGPLHETLPAFRSRLTPESPLSYVSLDVDYYSSSVDALRLFEGAPEAYLPVVDLYLDDVAFESHNTYSGELGAVRDFNANQTTRKIEPHRMLRESRLFKNAPWISQMYSVHILDHELRSPAGAKPLSQRVLNNPYVPGQPI